MLFVTWFRTGKPLIKNVNKYLAYALIAIGTFLKGYIARAGEIYRFNFREYLE